MQKRLWMLWVTASCRLSARLPLSWFQSSWPLSCSFHANIGPVIWLAVRLIVQTGAEWQTDITVLDSTGLVFWLDVYRALSVEDKWNIRSLWWVLTSFRGYTMLLLLNITFLQCEVFTVSAFEFSCPCVSWHNYTFELHDDSRWGYEAVLVLVHIQSEVRPHDNNSTSHILREFLACSLHMPEIQP